MVNSSIGTNIMMMRFLCRLYTLQMMVKGITTFIPGFYSIARSRNRQTLLPRYCYAVWMRHLIKLHEHQFALPDTVVELGPGGSIGAGLAAILSGASTYTALDASPHANT